MGGNLSRLMNVAPSADDVPGHVRPRASRPPGRRDGRLAATRSPTGSSTSARTSSPSSGTSGACAAATTSPSCCPTTSRYFEVVWAALRSGLYYTPVNWHLTAPEVAYIVGDCGARSVVTSIDLADRVTDIDPEIALVIDGDLDGWERYEDVVGKQPTTPLAEEPEGQGMFYSSGTTGPAEGDPVPAPRSHRARRAPARAVREPDRHTGRRRLPLPGAAVPHGSGGLLVDGPSRGRHHGDPRAVGSRPPASRPSSATASPPPSSCRPCSCGSSSCRPRCGSATTCRRCGSSATRRRRARWR